MHALDILGDPVRRRILELLADGERAAGQIGAVVQEEFGISQPAVSQHLRVLRENGFATVRAKGTQRLYSVDPTPLKDVDMWLNHYRKFWNRRLDALDTELRRGARERRAERAAAECAAEAPEGAATPTGAAETRADDGGDQPPHPPGA